MLFSVAKLIEVKASIAITDPIFGQEVFSADLSGVDDDDNDGNPEIDFAVVAFGKSAAGTVEIPVAAFRGAVEALLTPVVRAARKKLFP